MNIEVSSNVDEVADLLSDIGTTLHNKAKVSAINKTAQQMRTQVRREISKETGIPQKLIRKRVLIRKRAKVSSPKAILFAGVFNVPVKDIGYRVLRRGISHRAPGGRMKRPSAFEATMPSGKSDVYERSGRKRLPIKRLVVEVRYAGARAMRKAKDQMPELYSKLFQREFNWRINQEIDRRKLRD